MKKTIKTLILILCCAFTISDVNAQLKNKKYNVLFIAVDDLKPELGCYGSSTVKSPNIDALAQKSTVFKSAYCQQAVCGPTRASLLCGLRPDRTKVWDLKTSMREQNPNVVTLPQYFKSNGYETIGMGKVFDASNVDKNLDAQSWSVPFKKTFELAAGYQDIVYGIYQSPELKKEARVSGNLSTEEGSFFEKNAAQGISRLSTEAIDVPDDAYGDGAMANYAIQQLEQLGKSDKPFFMAVGFKKPHLPFVAPKKYWDLYKREDIKLAPFQQKALDSPEFAYHNAGELRNYSTDIKSLDEKSSLLKLSEEKQRELIHGYTACVSYTDTQIGKVIEALKKTGLDKNTIIILWGDHGWHFGDHSLWCKHSNFEQATKVPLMISLPNLKTNKDYNHPVELVDIYPTLCELTGLEVGKHLDGKSLVPALKSPEAIKPFAVSQYPRDSKIGAKEIMGYSLRDNQYRFTEWVGNFFTTSKPFNPADVKALELYDLKNDPNETKNIANDPAMAKTVEKLKNQLHEFYKQQLAVSVNQ